MLRLTILFLYLLEKQAIFCLILEFLNYFNETLEICWPVTKPVPQKIQFLRFLGSFKSHPWTQVKRPRNIIGRLVLLSLLLSRSPDPTQMAQKVVKSFT